MLPSVPVFSGRLLCRAGEGLHVFEYYKGIVSCCRMKRWMLRQPAGACRSLHSRSTRALQGSLTKT